METRILSVSFSALTRLPRGGPGPDQEVAPARPLNRQSPKIWGEWATREGSPTPNFNAALGEAAWMTGMERNRHPILMSGYALAGTESARNP
jgi:hypothetical protein